MRKILKAYGQNAKKLASIIEPELAALASGQKAVMDKSTAGK